MGKPINRTISFFTFDLPLNAAFNRLALQQAHKQNSNHSQYWSIEGTKQVLKAAYWYEYVPRHFAVFIIGGSLLYWVITQNLFTSVGFSVLSLFLAVLYMVLFLTIYRPFYSRIYLPQINSLIDRWTKDDADKKAVEEAKKVPPQSIEPTKSARTQTKIPALTVIHYVLFQTAGIKALACDDESAKLINKLTGVDTGSIKENLRRIIRPSNLTVKERAEMRKAIDLAADYFNQLDHQPALRILEQMKQKYQRD